MGAWDDAAEEGSGETKTKKEVGFAPNL